MIRLNAIDIGEGLPSEFRLFRAGMNATTKGDFLFDEAAASSVMAAYEKHGVDIMIDLEHLSLAQDSASFNPDAVGWCKLEVRNGELWAVDVKWNDEGQRRLSEKRQRYISPAFDIDEEGRITRLLNMALTALPATDFAESLIAARADVTTNQGTNMLNESDAKLAGDMLAAMQLIAEGAADDGLKSLAASTMAALAAMVEGEKSEEEDPESKPEPVEMAEAKPEPVAASVVELSQARKLNDELAAEVIKLRAQVADGEKALVIASNRDRLTPALEKWAQGQTVEALRAFLSVAPVTKRTEKHEPERKHSTVVELSEDEKEVARVFGRSIEEATKMKAAKLAARKDG